MFKAYKFKLKVKKNILSMFHKEKRKLNQDRKVLFYDFAEAFEKYISYVGCENIERKYFFKTMTIKSYKIFI